MCRLRGCGFFSAGSEVIIDKEEGTRRGESFLLLRVPVLFVADEYIFISSGVSLAAIFVQEDGSLFSDENPGYGNDYCEDHKGECGIYLARCDWFFLHVGRVDYPGAFVLQSVAQGCFLALL